MSNAELHSTCERIARLEQQRKELAAEISAIKKDAKDKGFDAALITKTVRVMLMGPKKRQETLEQHELFDTYLAAAGLLPSFEANVDERETARNEIVTMAKQDGGKATVRFGSGPEIDMDDKPAFTAAVDTFVRDALGKTPAEPKLWAAPDVAAGIPSHDADTGEIIEPPSSSPAAEQAGAELPNVPPTLAAPAVLSQPDPDIALPDFLNRAKRREMEAAE